MQLPSPNRGTFALAIFATALICGLFYARHLENEHVQDLSKLKLPLKDRSAALHAAAFRRRDTLLLYGSSELTIPNPLRATEFFRKGSSGFQVFPIGHIGTTPLVILEDLAALGSNLRDKRVVVSISPTWFYSISQRASFYEGNFSPLGAYALAFSDGPNWKESNRLDCAEVLARSGGSSRSARMRRPDCFVQPPAMTAPIELFLGANSCRRPELTPEDGIGEPLDGICETLRVVGVIQERFAAISHDLRQALDVRRDDRKP